MTAEDSELECIEGETDKCHLNEKSRFIYGSFEIFLGKNHEKFDH
jgi:hypothetical protein